MSNPKHVDVPEEAVRAALADGFLSEGIGEAYAEQAARAAIQAAAPIIASKAVEEARDRIQRGRDCPEHGYVCGRPNWTGYCRWRAEGVRDQSPDYYDALSAAESRIGELETRVEKAVEEERERLLDLYEHACGVEEFLRKVTQWEGSAVEDLAEAIEDAEKLTAALDQNGDSDAEPDDVRESRERTDEWGFQDGASDV